MPRKFSEERMYGEHAHKEMKAPLSIEVFDYAT